jgi:hypothetical protein
MYRALATTAWHKLLNPRLQTKTQFAYLLQGLEEVLFHFCALVQDGRRQGLHLAQFFVLDLDQTPQAYPVCIR